MDLRPTTLESPLDRRARVFLGIGPAPADWAEALSLWVAQLNRRLERFGKNFIRWTAPENLHLTLRFFGSVTQGEILQIDEILQEIGLRYRPLTLRARDLAFFPERVAPRVAAIRLEDLKGEVLRLEATIRAKTFQLGQLPENRAFHPHVTFGRIRIPDRRVFKILLDLWSEGAAPKLPEWEVAEVTVFKSDLGAGGSIYTPLSRLKLGGEGDSPSARSPSAGQT